MSYVILGGLAVGAAFCAYWSGWNFGKSAGLVQGATEMRKLMRDPLADGLREAMRGIRQQRVWVGYDGDLMISNSIYAETTWGDYDIIVMEHRADFERECG